MSSASRRQSVKRDRSSMVTAATAVLTSSDEEEDETIISTDIFQPPKSTVETPTSTAGSNVSNMFTISNAPQKRKKAVSRVNTAVSKGSKKQKRKVAAVDEIKKNLFQEVASSSSPLPPPPPPPAALSPQLPKKRARYKLKNNLSPTIVNTEGDDEELRIICKGLQKAKEVLAVLADPVKVNIDNLTLTPEDETVNELGKALLRQRPFRPNMYSNYKTIVHVFGRFLKSLALAEAGVHTKFNTWGVNLWRHQWSDDLNDRVGARCYHGERMIRKEHMVQLPVTSEAGMEAVSQGRGVVKSSGGRYPKQVVEILQPNLLVCREDAGQRYPECSALSCSMSFTEGQKALTAMRNFSQLMVRAFPNLPTRNKIIPIVTHCFCTYGDQKRTMGRQLPKMTPFNVMNLPTHTSGTSGSRGRGGAVAGGNDDDDDDETFWCKNPCVFVFQCCNPTTSRGRASTISCDFKLSAVDLLYVMQTVRYVWKKAFPSQEPRLTIPLFKWNPSLCYRESRIPVLAKDDAKNVFGSFSESENENVDDDDDDEDENDDDE